MSNIEVDYFKASFTSDGNTNNLEIDDNGEIFYKNLDEEDLMKLINVANNQTFNNNNLLEQLKSEFPLKETKTKTKTKKRRKTKKTKTSKHNKKSKIIESIDSVFN